MSIVLTLLGIVLLLPALAGIGLGVYAAIDPKTRKLGTLFALWWIPGAAAAIGVLIQDLVTFTVALVCFVVGGIVFFFKSWSVRKGRTLRGHNARSDKIPQTARTAGKRRRSAS